MRISSYAEALSLAFAAVTDASVSCNFWAALFTEAKAVAIAASSKSTVRDLQVIVLGIVPASAEDAFAFAGRSFSTSGSNFSIWETSFSSDDGKYFRAIASIATVRGSRIWYAPYRILGSIGSDSRPLKISLFVDVASALYMILASE